MSKKAPDTVVPPTAAQPEAPPALILFGLDEANKAHAARFGEADVELAERAAGMMGLRCLKVATPEVAAIALGLPQGRVFSSGRGFVPFAKTAVYDRLSGFNEVYAPAPPPEVVDAPAPEVTSTPATWADIVVGGLVLASEGESEGWFEAVVIEDRGEDLLVLRWRDWPDNEPFPRRREHIALLPPASAEVGAQV